MKGIRERIMMESALCPSWLYFSLNTFFRKGIHNPVKILKPYVRRGDTAVDLGCGPGFFTMALAGLAGSAGKVIAVDIQERAIEIIQKKVSGTVYENIVQPVLGDGSAIPVSDKADFVLSFWMLHEVPDKKVFLEQVKSIMKPGGLYLLVEPRVHVSKRTYLDEISIAESCGMKHTDSPKIGISRAALFSI